MGIKLNISCTIGWGEFFLKFPKVWIGLIAFVLMAVVAQTFIIVSGTPATMMSSQDPDTGYITEFDGDTGKKVKVYDPSTGRIIFEDKPHVVLGNQVSAIIVLAGWFFWAFCVYRIHAVVFSFTGGKHAFSPKVYGALNLIPIFNVYWATKWPGELISLVNQRSKVKMKSLGYQILFAVSALFILGVVEPQSGWLGGIVALAVTYITGMTMTKKIRQSLKSAEQVNDIENAA